MRVEVAAELAFRYRADALADFFCGKRPAAIADPERIAGDRRRRTTHQLRPVVRDISFDAGGEAGRQGHLERPSVLGLARAEGDPPFIATTLHAGADRHGGDIAGAYGASGEDANYQPVTEQQGLSPGRQSGFCLGPLHQLQTQINDCGRGHQSRPIIARGCGHAVQPSPDPTQPHPIGIRSHHGCGTNELEKAASHGARVIALAQIGDVCLDASAGDPGLLGMPCGSRSSGLREKRQKAAVAAGDYGRWSPAPKMRRDHHRREDRRGDALRSRRCDPVPAIVPPTGSGERGRSASSVMPSLRAKAAARI